MKRIKFLNWMSAIALISAYTVLFLFGYWLLHRYNPITFKGDRFIVLNKVVKQGESVKYIADYCKNVDIPAIVSRSFVNDLVFSTPQTTTKKDKGCGLSLVVVPIPRELPPGEYHLFNTYTYQVNPLKKITVTHITENFKVIE